MIIKEKKHPSEKKGAICSNSTAEVLFRYPFFYERGFLDFLRRVNHQIIWNLLTFMMLRFSSVPEFLMYCLLKDVIIKLISMNYSLLTSATYTWYNSYNSPPKSQFFIFYVCEYNSTGLKLGADPGVEVGGGGAKTGISGGFLRASHKNDSL